MSKPRMMTTSEMAAAMNLPAGALDVLRWLLGGSRSLTELVTQRAKILHETHPEGHPDWFDYYASQSVLYDLSALAQDNLVHINSEGRIEKTEDDL